MYTSQCFLDFEQWIYEYNLKWLFRHILCTCGYVPYLQYRWLCRKSIIWYFSMGKHFNTICRYLYLFMQFTKFLLLQPRGKPWLVMFMSVARGIFIPVLMFCNAQPRHHLPVYIHSDIYYILITIIFAITNGYLCNLTFILTPT